MHLFIVGAGRIGLVSAVGFADLGITVTAADIDIARIERLRRGEAPIFEPDLEDGIRRHLASGRLAFTGDLTPPAEALMSFVTVGTPTGPDGPLSMTYVEAAVGGLLDRVDARHTIVVRSTLPLEGPDRLRDLADRHDRPSIVTNPEFLREGSALADFARPDRVIVGWLEPRDRAAADAVASLYASLEAPTLVADARSVALIKVASNVLLATKVAYANELARICDLIDADVDVVADGIGLDRRLGRAFLTAGPGFGGSCLPEQAVALALEATRRGLTAPLIDAVSRSNDAHRQAIVTDIDRLLATRRAGGLTGARVAILGLAFKARTDDVRESPGLWLARALRAAGATVVGTDPKAIGTARAADPDLATASSPADAAEDADVVLVATEWPEYGELDWPAIAARMSGDLVYDTRAIVDGGQIRSAGLRLASLGRVRDQERELLRTFG